LWWARCWLRGLGARIWTAGSLASWDLGTGGALGGLVGWSMSLVIGVPSLLRWPGAPASSERLGGCLG
jgi:hypothetical protein